MEPSFQKVSKSDPQEVRRAIAALFDNTAIVELRVLKAHDGQRSCGNVTGYFDGEHREQLALAACGWSGLAEAVYVTLIGKLPEANSTGPTGSGAKLQG